MNPPSAFKPPQCEGLEVSFFFKGEEEVQVEPSGSSLVKGKSKTKLGGQALKQRRMDEMTEVEIKNHERKLSQNNLICNVIE